MARRTNALLPAALAATALCAVLRGACQAFVPAPVRGSSVGLLGAVAAVVSPLLARAELPPLEDLPLEEVTATRQFGPEDQTFMGISFPQFLFAVAFAVCWALFWVTTSKPAKDAEGQYTTYLGGGALPPEGFTNPLDVRMQEEPIEAPSSGSKLPTAKKPASSAIV